MCLPYFIIRLLTIVHIRAMIGLSIQKAVYTMGVPITITVQDFVYDFYTKVADNMPHRTVEEIMASALFRYAGIVIEEMHLNEPTQFS